MAGDHPGAREPGAGPGVLRARLQVAPPGATGEDGAAHAGITAALAATRGRLAAQIKALETQIGAPAGRPPRRAHLHLLAPRPARVRAARLLAEIGDCRSRFPDPRVPGRAGRGRPGHPPVRHPHPPTFRWAVSRQLRDAVCDFAADSRHASPWAAAIYDDARARGKDHPHAVRILARAWIFVIWRCWQDGTAYDPAKHTALQRILDQQQASQAAAPAPAGGPVTAAITAALRAYAAGFYAEEAGTELLISHGGFLDRHGLIRFVDTFASSP